MMIRFHAVYSFADHISTAKRLGYLPVRNAFRHHDMRKVIPKRAIDSKYSFTNCCLMPHFLESVSITADLNIPIDAAMYLNFFGPPIQLMEQTEIQFR